MTIRRRRNFLRSFSAYRNPGMTDRVLALNTLMGSRHHTHTNVRRVAYALQRAQSADRMDCRRMTHWLRPKPRVIKATIKSFSYRTTFNIVSTRCLAFDTKDGKAFLLVILLLNEVARVTCVYRYIKFIYRSVWKWPRSTRIISHKKNFQWKNK